MSALTEAQSGAAILRNQAPEAAVRVSSYLPVLDGVRAVSIGLVIVGHLLIYEQPRRAIENIGHACGAVGVSMFFVLSGYLITRLLLLEEASHGAVSLKHFYVRRFLRIIPAAYAFLLVLLVLSGFGVIYIPVHDYVASFLYFRNVVGRAHETSHLWSLAIEEQFYLLWPPLLAVLAPRSRIKAVLGILVSILVWRSSLVALDAVSVGTLYVRTDLRIDTILMGCLLALMDHEPKWEAWTARLGRRPSVQYLAVAALAVWAILFRDLRGASALDSTLTALLIALVLNGLLKLPSRLGARLLQTRPAIFVGRLSYSLYLWQQLFMGPSAAMPLLRSFPVNLVLSFLASFGSYVLIEKPALRLKERWGAARARPAVSA